MNQTNRVTVAPEASSDPEDIDCGLNLSDRVLPLTFTNLGGASVITAKAANRLSLQNRPAEVAGPGPVCSTLPSSQHSLEIDELEIPEESELPFL